MPELPEVETLRRSLEKHLPGRRLTHVVVLEPRLRTRLDPQSLAAALVGRTVVGLGRRSKYLLLHLSDGHVLIVHLGMSGRLVLADPWAPLAPHTHVVLGVEGAGELRYSDPRRFGMLFVVHQDALEGHPRFARLGPEPFGPEFGTRYLCARARGVRKPVKNFLMDAKVVAGVGNIYACEALYRARVHPGTAARRLRPERWRRVHAAVLAVLRAAVHDRGTTLQDFRDADGRDGGFQNRLRVYDHAGESCRRCGRTIRRIVQAGRSTFYCPGCQH